MKENSKAEQFLNQTNYIDKIIILERDNKINQKHDGFKGFFKLASDLKKYNFDKVFIFNSSLRYNLIAKFSKLKKYFNIRYLKNKINTLLNTAKKLIKKNLNIDVNDNPEIQIDNSLFQKQQ